MFFFSFCSFLFSNNGSYQEDVKFMFWQPTQTCITLRLLLPNRPRVIKTTRKSNIKQMPPFGLTKFTEYHFGYQNINLIWTIVKTYKTTIPTSYEPVLYCYQQTFYTQISMYLIIQLCFYVCFNDLQQLPEDDQDRSKHVGFMTDCV